MANRFLSNIRINDAYTFPASDGTNNQVIKTDGSGNLSFGQLAADSASVMYKDTFTGDGSTTGFSLANALNDEVQSNIYIDGVYQSKSTYSVSGTTVTFSTAPASGHEIEVISTTGINSGPTAIYTDTFTANGSATAFTLGQTVHDENQTIVFLNGVYQFKGTYTLSGTTLTLDTAPANGVAIEVMSIGSAYSGGDILYDHDFTSAGLMTTNGSGVYSITANNSANWNTAYGWGDHSTQGYITDGNTNWNNSYGFITSSSTETLTNKSGNISMFTNDSNYATQSYVGTQISNLVDSSPATLDTLNELAAALGDDPNFATTTANSIGTKLPLAGGTLTGNLILDDGSGASPSIEFINSNNDSWSIFNGSQGVFNIREGATDRLEFAAGGDATFAGNVGVGGKTPAYGLSLAQGTGASNKIAWTDSTPNFRASMWANSSDDKFKIATGNASSVETVALEIDTSQNATFKGNIILGDGTARSIIGPTNQSLIINAKPNSAAEGLLFQINGTDKLSILQDGNATFAGNIILGDTPQIQLGTNNDAQIDHTGSHLFIDNSVGSSYLRNTSTGDIILRNSTGGDIQFDNEFAGNILFNTSNIERMRVNSSGNVGIGRTTDTAKKLDVLGAGLRLMDTSNYSSITIGASGWQSNYPYQRLDTFNSDGSGYYWALGHRKTDGTKTIRMLVSDTSTRYVSVIDALYIQSFASNELGGSGNYPSFSTNVVLSNNGNSYINGGNVGIGTTSPQTYLQIGDYPSNNIDITTYPDVPSEHMIHLSAPETNERYGAGISFGENSFTAANITVQDAGGNGSLHMLFGTRNTSGIVQERMRITSDGYVLIGTPDVNISNDAGLRFDASGEAFASIATNGYSAWHVYDFNTNNYRFYVTGAGQIFATNTSISAISDITLKENIKPLETGLDEVMKLQPRRFDWKNGDGENVAGFIAQEVEEVLPDLISDAKYTDEETKKSLKMGDMIPTLVKAIQELKADNDSLKARIETLENN